ncbi:MAG: hypothetical protein ACU0CA_03900 [Paracoccaceae bacterium]
MADGFVRGRNLICGVHNWDYRLDSGVNRSGLKFLCLCRT